MNTTSEALIIFLKNNEPGKVKTRLAKTMGHNRALEVYLELQRQTEQAVRYLTADKMVYFSDYIPDKDSIWPDERYHHFVQKGSDLGQRMNNAFDELFDKGYERVCIIGSDCPYLTHDILENAFNRLSERDIVIGPTRDGGYYLLGLIEPHEELFEDIDWGDSRVFDRTIQKLMTQCMIWYELPILEDVDTEDDLDRYRLFARQRELRSVTQ